MTGSGEITDDLTARAAVVARHLADLHRWTATQTAGQPTAPYTGTAPAPEQIPGGEPGLLPPPRPEPSDPLPLPGPVQGAMRPGPSGSAPYRIPEGRFEVGAWPPPPRRPPARLPVEDPLPPADVTAVPPPDVAAVQPPPADPDDVTMAWRTVPDRPGDPNATQAIGLHRAADPPTPRAGDRPRVRGIARVLPWNWGRRGNR